jgi:hypothetical protein
MSNINFLKSEPAFVKIFKATLVILIFVTGFFGAWKQANVLALTPAFDPNLVISDKELHYTNLQFATPELIQSYLCDRGSVLCKIKVPVEFSSNSLILSEALFGSKPTYLKPSENIKPYKNKLLTPAEIIWLVAMKDLGNGCSTENTNICYNNRIETFNPGIILAKIQLEQGLVEGVWATKSPEDPLVKNRIDRAMGYRCPETGCDPAYFGFFSQVYYGTRILRLREKTCEMGEPVAFTNFRGVHKVGNTLNIANDYPITGTTLVTFKNGITCSLYIYTPYISAQKKLRDIINRWNLSNNLINLKNENLDSIIFSGGFTNKKDFPSDKPKINKPNKPKTNKPNKINKPNKPKTNKPKIVLKRIPSLTKDSK